MENFISSDSLPQSGKWGGFSQTLTKLEDRKVKINGNKVTLAISQIGMLNRQGIPDQKYNESGTVDFFKGVLHSR